jgi:hypothetical protein
MSGSDLAGQHETVDEAEQQRCSDALRMNLMSFYVTHTIHVMPAAHLVVAPGR